MLLGTLTILLSINIYANSKSICGNRDDRVLSYEPKVGRLSKLEDNKGCTATLISDSCAITGYGVDRGDSSGNFAQQTHTGKLKTVGTLINRTHLRHTADTTGGNSGSSIILESTEQIIGIHSHAGCTSSGGANQGTVIAKHKKLVKAIKTCLASD